MPSDPKLEAFKTDINLVEYAGACGYALVQRESSRNSAVMKSGTGDKIIIAKNANRHWVYFSVHDSSDNGTIIDFVLRRAAANNLGRVKQELGRWLSGATDHASRVNLPRPDLTPSSHDRHRVIRAISSMVGVETHPYLEARGLGTDVTNSLRFRGQIFMDARRNAVFPHHDEEGLCGYEIKNRGFTGFAPGGVKGVWGSNSREGDDTLILAESAIDAMSFFAVTRREGMYLSLAGAWGPRTAPLILATLEGMRLGSDVVLAFDNDEQGQKYVDQATQLLAGRGHLIEIALPPYAGEDWNDRLRRLNGIPPTKMPQNRVHEGASRGE